MSPQPGGQTKNQNLGASPHGGSGLKNFQVSDPPSMLPLSSIFSWLALGVFVWAYYVFEITLSKQEVVVFHKVGGRWWM